MLLVACVCLGGEPGSADELPPEQPLPPAAAAATAVRQAQAAITLARDAGNLWLATPGRLAAARAAVARGDFTQAVASAERARHEAELARNQAQLERARYLLDNATGIDPQTRATVIDLLSNYDGKTALRTLESGVAGP